MTLRPPFNACRFAPKVLNFLRSNLPVFESLPVTYSSVRTHRTEGFEVVCEPAGGSPVTEITRNERLVFTVYDCGESKTADIVTLERLAFEIAATLTSEKAQSDPELSDSVDAVFESGVFRTADGERLCASFIMHYNVLAYSV